MEKRSDTLVGVFSLLCEDQRDQHQLFLAWIFDAVTMPVGRPGMIARVQCSRNAICVVKGRPFFDQIALAVSLMEMDADAGMGIDGDPGIHLYMAAQRITV